MTDFVPITDEAWTPPPREGEGVRGSRGGAALVTAGGVPRY